MRTIYVHTQPDRERSSRLEELLNFDVNLDDHYTQERIVKVDGRDILVVEGRRKENEVLGFVVVPGYLLAHKIIKPGYTDPVSDVETITNPDEKRKVEEAIKKSMAYLVGDISFW